MSPGQDIPVANENEIVILVVPAWKIKRRFARRIGHQNNCLCTKHSLVFLGRTVLARIDVLLQYLSRSVAARFCVWQSRSASLDQCLSGKLRYSNSKSEGSQEALRAWNGRVCEAL